MTKKILIAAAVCSVLAAALYEGIPMLLKNRIVGRLVDAVYLPGTDGAGILCILTDGSWSFFSKYQSAGRQVQGRKGIFCKTHLYRYDPLNRRILARKTVKYEQLPPPAVLLLAGDNLWEISTDPDRLPVRAMAFRLRDGERLIDSTQFYAHFAGPGISIRRQRLHPHPPYYLSITTEDDRNMVIDLASGSKAADLAALLAPQKGTIDRFALADPEGGPRRRLWRIAGGDWRLYETSIPERAFGDLSYFARHFNAAAEAIAPAQYFWEGILVYQDDDQAVILHQEETTPDADRRLTCIGGNGRIRWSLAQAQLFPGLALRQKKPFSSDFFVQSRIRIKKNGDVMLIVFEPEGLIGIDAASGRELWRHVF